MSLMETFEKVHPSIVAFASRVAFAVDGKPPVLPIVFGTGFIVDPRGIVVTNRHVVEVFEKLPPMPNTNDVSAFAMVFSGVANADDDHVMGAALVQILGWQALTEFVVDRDYYGADVIPDLAFVHVRVQGVPMLSLLTEPWSLRIGMPVATAGFALGTSALAMKGTVNQITPFLRHGIVSSLLPFPCPSPDGFSIDIASQGGASGSPIFRVDDGAVLGVLHGGFEGTNITYAVPSHVAAAALSAYLEHAQPDFAGSPTFAEYAAQGDSEEATWIAMDDAPTD